MCVFYKQNDRLRKGNSSISGKSVLSAKGAVGKPMKKNGKIDKKAEICKCNSCGYEEPTEQAESGLVLNVDYKCPHCGNEGQTTTEYKRKTFEGVPSYIFECTKCKKKIGITKKLKEPKKKKIADAVEE